MFNNSEIDNSLISAQYPAGYALFSSSESLVTDLSPEEESVISGGAYYDPHKPNPNPFNVVNNNNINVVVPGNFGFGYGGES